MPASVIALQHYVFLLDVKTALWRVSGNPHNSCFPKLPFYHSSCTTFNSEVNSSQQLYLHNVPYQTRNPKKMYASILF